MNINEALVKKDSLPFRQGAIALVLNKNNKVLLVQMLSYKENQWRFPGGGIDEDEKPGDALLREFSEELGSDKFEIIAESKYKTEYFWPEEIIKMRHEQKGELFKGQQQYQFLVKYSGEENEINPDPNEIKKIKWISINELPEHLIFNGQLELTQKVLKEFNLID